MVKTKHNTKPVYHEIAIAVFNVHTTKRVVNTECVLEWQ